MVNFIEKIKSIKRRRFLFIIPAILLTLDITLQDVRFDLYQGIMATLTGMITVYNFPFIISGMHSKPKYIEDIISEYELTEDRRHYYKRIFEYVIGLLSSILLGGLVYNTLRTNNEVTGWLNLAGIIGGVISIYGKFLKFSGKAFLSCLDKMKQRKERTQSIDRTEIAMKDIQRIQIEDDKSTSQSQTNQQAPDYLIKTQLSKHSLGSGRGRSNT